MSDQDNQHYVSVVKVDETLGVVFGMGIICKINGADYYDVQGDHIPEDVMLAATTDFMLGDRVAKDMHFGEAKGKIVHSFPLTTEFCDASGITTQKTGWLIGMKPDDPAILQKFADKIYTGFSIGGSGHFEVEND